MHIMHSVCWLDQPRRPKLAGLGLGQESRLMMEGDLSAYAEGAQLFLFKPSVLSQTLCLLWHPVLPAARATVAAEPHY